MSFLGMVARRASWASAWVVLFGALGCGADESDPMDRPDGGVGTSDGGAFFPDGGGGDPDPDAGPPGDPGVSGAPTLDSDVFRQSALLAVLPDGNVWVGGGVIVRGPKGGGPGRVTGREEAEVIDPVANTFTLEDPMELGRRSGQATVLPDGRILITGGAGGPPGEPAMAWDQAEVVDPDTYETTFLEDLMVSPRSGHLAWLVEGGPNAGTVVLLGGNVLPLSAERFDPETDTFAEIPVTDPPDTYPQWSTVLADGRVLLTGFEGDPDVYDQCVVFDPETGTFTDTGAMTANRQYHRAALLPDGRVLAVGGRAGRDALGSAEVWDPETGTWSAITGTPPIPRALFGIAALGSGRIVVAGGSSVDSVATDSVEIYDPETDGFLTADGVLTNMRTITQAIALRDGRVMVIGGQLQLPRGNSMIVSTVDYVAE